MLLLKFWENYILACKTCNTAYKLDTEYIFNPSGSVTIQNVTPSRSKSAIKIQPPNHETLLINPRVENPTRFIMLDLVGRTFNYIPKKAKGTREFERAEFTINTLLKLNGRTTLVEARKAAFRTFQNLLRSYIACGKAATHAELEMAIGDDPQVDNTQPLANEISRIQEHIKNAIKNHPHPTVWLEMKRQRAKLPVTSKLFKTAPEALRW